MQRAPVLRLIVDNFAGGGGASTGIARALGREPDIAINHDPEALAMHAMNHPTTEHLLTDVWDVDPVTACRGLPVQLAWFSPDCKHFSKAKGGKPVEKKIRGLAWVAVKWAKAVHPDVIMLENVEEFRDWGPIDENNMPIKAKLGFTYRRFIRALEREGYKVEDNEMRAMDYGTPTTRKRLFLIARRDGLPIVWPKPTHGPGLEPYLTAGEDVIDWSIPCPSIFTRKRPLADNTLRRIARGIQKFVIDDANPFIVRIGQTGHGDGGKVKSIEDPLTTVTSKAEHLLIRPYLAGVGGRKGQSPETDVTRPFHTVTAKADTVLVTPYLVPRYGERPGQAPRGRHVKQPLSTIVPTQNGDQVVAAFLAKHNLGVVGQPLTESVHTITAIDQKAVVASTIVKLKGTSKHGQSTHEPLHTVAAGGNHFAEVRAFLIKFYSEGGQWASCNDPMHTIPTVDRMGLVTVHGEPYRIVDIGMRMLSARELFRAQGFGDEYIIDGIELNGRTLPARSQVRMCGNSVCPPLAQALVEANIPRQVEVPEFAEAGD